LLTLVLGSIFLILKLPLIFLILAFTISSFLNVCFVASILFFKFKITLRPKYDRETFFFIGKIAIPFAFAAIFARVYSYIDSILLSKLAGDIAVGWYSIPYKITYAFQFIPIALAASIFPAMSSYFVSSKGLLARTFERAVYYLTIISVPIAFGVYAIADKLIHRIWGEAFEASIIPLQILIFSLIFLFANFPVGSLLNACNRQKRNTINIGIAMIVNVVLNLILIPRFTFIGTSIASLISIFTLLVLGLYVTRQIITPNWGFLTKTLFKTVVSAGIMLILLLALKESVSFILLIPIGIIVYFVILFLLRGFGQREYIRIYQAIRKKLT